MFGCLVRCFFVFEVPVGGLVSGFDPPGVVPGVWAFGVGVGLGLGVASGVGVVSGVVSGVVA